MLIGVLDYGLEIDSLGIFGHAFTSQILRIEGEISQTSRSPTRTAGRRQDFVHPEVGHAEAPIFTKKSRIRSVKDSRLPVSLRATG